MNYQFRITLPGIKGFYRVYKVNPANTFYAFHKQLQADLSFPVDQPILFKAYDENQNVIARYAFIDLGFGTVDDVKIGTAIANGAVSFDYFYDTQSKRRIIITLEEEKDPCADVSVPTMLSDLKGPDPTAFDNGFVAFEDLPKEKRRLPDDDDDDDSFDDEDDKELDEDDDAPEELYDKE